MNYSILGFAYCHLSAAPLRAEPDDRTEMTSQLLFGETMMIIEKYRSWRKVRCSIDDHEGWIDVKQFAELDDGEFRRLSHLQTSTSIELVQVISDFTGNRMFPLLIGSSLPGLANHQFNIGKAEYLYQGTAFRPPARLQPTHVIETAYLYLHSPY